MKTKTRMLSAILCIILIFSWLLFSAACGAASLTVTFDYNYDGAPQPLVEEIESGEVVTPPQSPSREGYAFTGWYNDRAATDEADFGYGITQSQTFYAGWEQTDVTVTFDPNYEGSTLTYATVEIGQAVAQPADPDRSGDYLFIGWYTDKNCTDEYNFETKVTQAFTLYAGWEEVDLSDTVAVNFMYNYEGAPDAGVYYSTRVKLGRRVAQPASPVREGYAFIGWYSNPECTELFSFTSLINEDTVIYAFWLHEYAFEAEYTDVSGITGRGYSGEFSGTDIILRDQDGSLGASNDFYVSYLYSGGIELTFEIYAEEAVENAVLEIALAAEYADVILSQSNYTVEVNGNALSYGQIELLGAEQSATKNIPFKRYNFAMGLTLRQGNNVIKLITDNNDPMTNSSGSPIGTMYATAPMVDCLYIYSDVAVTWAEGKCFESNIEGK